MFLMSEKRRKKRRKNGYLFSFIDEVEVYLIDEYSNHFATI